jgi:ubiquinone biosynthesis accessory factor UbiJ
MNTLPDFFTSFFAKFPSNPPFSLLKPNLDFSKLPSPPDWLIAQGHNRIVLLLNHVLQQEPEAMQRLTRQKGRVVKLAWQQFTLLLTATPVGLLAVAPQPDATSTKIDLLLEITDTDIADLGQKLMRGDKPNVRIEGDIQLAAEVQWLAQNVQWDLEDDLARFIGDVPAHHAMNVARAVQGQLKAWLAPQMQARPQTKAPTQEPS